MRQTSHQAEQDGRHTDQDKTRKEMRSLRGAAPAVIVRRCNPIIAGWTAYCASRGCVRLMRTVGLMM
jgi:hypothetical protein